MSPAPGPRALRLLVVDDSALVRQGLKAVLAAHAGSPPIEIVGEAATAAAGVAAALRLQPDVVLLDIRLPDGTGFDACRQMLAAAPDLRVLFLTSAADDALIAEALRTGAQGYLLKDIDSDGLVRAIHDVAAGRAILDPVVTARVMALARGEGRGADPIATLSPQEQRVLALISAGRTNKEAGAELHLSEKTVKNYLSSIFEKLQVSRRAEAASLYTRHRT